MNTRVKRYGPILLILLVLGICWWAAFNYLVEFRNPDVPFLTTPEDVVETMVELAEIKPGEKVYDLGCGDARLVIAAAKKTKINGVGVDIDPEWVETARQKVREAGLSEQITIKRGDLFRMDFTDADVILMFLMTSVNEKLIPEFDKLKPGSRIISHHFRIPGIKPTQKIEKRCSETGLDHPIYVFVTPLERE